MGHAAVRERWAARAPIAPGSIASLSRICLQEAVVALAPEGDPSVATEVATVVRLARLAERTAEHVRAFVATGPATLAKTVRPAHRTAVRVVVMGAAIHSSGKIVPVVPRTAVRVAVMGAAMRFLARLVLRVSATAAPAPWCASRPR